MELVFFDKVTGKVSGVHHKPELLSENEKKGGLMVESFSPPSDSDEYFDWEARVVDNQLTWQKNALPISKFQFRKLFTLEELAKIKTGEGIAQEDVPVLDVIREDFELFDQSNLGDPHVVEVVNWLHTRGVLQSNERKHSILQTSEPVTKEK